MSVMVFVCVVAVFAAAVQRLRGGDRSPTEVLALAGALALAAIAIVGSVLAVVGWFQPAGVSGALLIVAAIVWPWRRPPTTRRRLFTPRSLIITGLILAAGIALRVPPMDYDLAGRDQGTYTLRAKQLVATGGTEVVDPIVAAAGDARGTRPGPADILGLYPKRREPWRAGIYESAYRPGWYLASRDEGRVVPQFLHGQPALLATGLLMSPSSGVAAMTVVVALVWMLVIIATARRLLPHGPWGYVAAALAVAHPLAVWVTRTALTETGAGVFVWGAALAGLCARYDRRLFVVAGVLLGGVAWLRGNGWLMAPVVLAVLWLTPRPTRGRQRAALPYLATVVGAVVVHAWTSYPYLHDELARLVRFSDGPVPSDFVLLAAVGAAAWLSIDELAFRGARSRVAVAYARQRAPWALLIAAAGALALYGIRALLSDGPPFSRLDLMAPVFTTPVLVIAAAGIGWSVLRTRIADATDVWLLAIAATLVVTLVLYGARTLPSAGLYYYGRYLFPELLPAIALGAAFACERMYTTVQRATSARAGAIAAGLLAAGVLVTSTSVMLTDPATRLREFDGANTLTDVLADQVPPGGVVIAGGEGWHHGHTFNQVGGALAIGHGITVLPYRTREAAYASAYELLVAGPEATGLAPPPVFLLLGEATHHYRRKPELPPVAAIDDLLPPPLRIDQAFAGEMFVHRLTPDSEHLPTRVTRDDLRMVLMKLSVDRQRRGETRWHLLADDRPTDLQIEGGYQGPKGELCLHAEAPLVLSGLPARDAGSLVLVAVPGTAAANPKWRIVADDRERGLTIARSRPRPRDTLGPLPFAHTPNRIEIYGAPKPRRRAACPHGGLAEVRWLAADRGALVDAGWSAMSLPPPHNLGHPIEPTGWVQGRGLSRYRAGITPPPDVRGISLVLTPEKPITFPPAFVPDADDELDLIVTLTGAHVGPSTRIIVDLDGEPAHTIDPPDERSRSWQSEVLQVRPRGPAPVFSLRLEHAAHGDEVLVRDIGLFSRATPRPSTVPDAMLPR